MCSDVNGPKMTFRKKSSNVDELSKLQKLFEDDFGSAQDHTTKSWVRGDVIQRGDVERIDAPSVTRGQLYRPGQQVLNPIPRSIPIRIPDSANYKKAP
jgi:hypothetical protein